MKKHDERIIILIIIIIALLSITILRLTNQTISGEAGKGGKDLELSPIVTECNDGIDNDGDGLIDSSYDLGCWSEKDDKEIAEPREEESGWTTFDKSSDTMIIYVSSSIGNDAWTGLCSEVPSDGSDCGPKKTTDAGYALLRDNYPDWLLFKRGDEFLQGQDFYSGEIAFRKNPKSGRSESEMQIIGAYGTGARPKFIDSGAIYLRNSNNIAIIDLDYDTTDHITPYRNSKAPNQIGIFNNVIIEGCRFAHGGGWAGPGTNFDFRRNVIVDAWSGDTGGLGSLFDGIESGLLIEDNVYDHNGWREGGIPTGASAIVRSSFNHNLYLVNSPNNVVRGNIFARSSLEGAMNRPGGLEEDNLFLNNPIGISWGRGDRTFEEVRASGIIRNNVVLDGDDLGPGVPRGVGIQITNAAETEIYGNIIAHQKTSLLGYGIWPDGTLRNINIHDNIVYKWTGSSAPNTIAAKLWADNWLGEPGSSSFSNNIIQSEKGTLVGGGPSSQLIVSGNTYYNSEPELISSNPPQLHFGSSISAATWAGIEKDAVWARKKFKDPERDISTYMASLGMTPTLEAFLDEARKQSKDNWREEFTAKKVNDYIQDGFSIIDSDIQTDLPKNFYQTLGPVAEYPLDGNAKNKAGKENDGVLKNGATFVDSSGEQVLSLDGIDDYLSVSTISLPGDLSISLRVFSPSSNSQFGFNWPSEAGTIILKNSWGHAGNWALYTRDNKIKWGGSVFPGSVTCPVPTSDEWHHIVVTLTGSSGRIIIDNNDCTENYAWNNAGVLGNGGGDISIGAITTPWDGGYAFRGMIKDVKIYNRILSNNEIETLYTGKAPTSKICGNNIIELGENCDGNTQVCTTSSGYSGTQSCGITCNFNPCTIAQSCGDEIKNGDEECDDGNNNNADSCTNQCLTNTATKTDSEKYKENFDGGKTTDLEKEEDLSKVPLTLERNGMGVIEFTNIIDFKKYDQTKTVNQILQKINDYIKIFNEKSGNILGTVSVDTGEQALKELSNEPATVTINIGGGKNINLLKVQRDGIDCEKPLCTVESYDSTTGELVFLVEHFTNYTVVENNETNNSYTPPASGGNGGGSGGGGGSIVKKNATSNNKTIAQAPPIISLTGQNNNAIETLKELGEEVSKNYEEKPKNAGIIIDTITIILIITIVILTIMTARIIKKINEGKEQQ